MPENSILLENGWNVKIIDKKKRHFTWSTVLNEGENDELQKIARKLHKEGKILTRTKYSVVKYALMQLIPEFICRDNEDEYGRVTY